MQEESTQQKEIREISENKNPYAQQCPNRHLYSEGFRAGYFHAMSSQKNTSVQADVSGSVCRITKAQIESIYEAKEDMKAMLGNGEDEPDKIWKKYIKNIEVFLSNNGLKAN